MIATQTIFLPDLCIASSLFLCVCVCACVILLTINVYTIILVSVSDANMAITHSTFTNNTVHYGSHYELSHVLDVRNTNMSISHSEFISNHYGSDMIHVSGGPITSIDHSKFISMQHWLHSYQCI